MDTRMPAEVFPPGEYLADELETRAWSQADFAEIIGRPVQFVSEIVNGKKEITAESATQIGAALGTSAEAWMSLQARFRLWQLSQDADQASGASRVTARARVASIIPLATLEKRGVIDRTEDLEELLAEVMSDFNMTDLDDEPQFRMAAKRSNHHDELSLTQRGWVWAAQREARKQRLATYDQAGLRQLAKGLAREMSEPDDLRDLPQRFAVVGVHLLFVEHMPSGKIDGAAFMVDEHPVIAVSGRGKRFDKLFFALMHEVAHVLSGHAQKGIALDDMADQREDRNLDPWEMEANKLAEELEFEGRVRILGPISTRAVYAKADELGVPVAFVVGNLQHHKDLDWRTTLARGLPNADDVLRAWAGDGEKER
jgi:HTH-type transcriptional regulator/antitoxin HigA